MVDQYKALTVTVILAAGLIGASPFILDKTVLNQQEQSIDTSLQVLGENESDRVGVNADRNLNYGALPVETNSTKYLNISSSERAIIRLSAEGNMSEYLDFEDEHYFIGEKNVPVKATAWETGQYNGTLNLESYTSRNKVGDYWIRFRGDYWPFSHWAESVKSKVSGL